MLLLNGDVRQSRGRRGAMPVLLARREPHHVPRPDLLDRAAPALRQAGAEGDDQGLAQRMGVPGRTGLAAETGDRSGRCR